MYEGRAGGARLSSFSPLSPSNGLSGSSSVAGASDVVNWRASNDVGQPIA
jgi:hypothetical protein